MYYILQTHEKGTYWDVDENNFVFILFRNTDGEQVWQQLRYVVTWTRGYSNAMIYPFRFYSRLSARIALKRWRVKWERENTMKNWEERILKVE